MFISLLTKVQKLQVIHKIKNMNKSHFFVPGLINRFCTGTSVVINNRPEVIKPSERIAMTGKYTL